MGTQQEWNKSEREPGEHLREYQKILLLWNTVHSTRME